MTLRETIARHRDLFYVQNWYDGEGFMDLVPSGKVRADFGWSGFPVHPFPTPVHAADLASLYVSNPSDHRWWRFYWTDDRDQYGNHVYVGGVGEYGIKGFQIHRHLEDPDCVWVMP